MDLCAGSARFGGWRPGAVCGYVSLYRSTRWFKAVINSKGLCHSCSHNQSPAPSNSGDETHLLRREFDRLWRYGISTDLYCALDIAYLAFSRQHTNDSADQRRLCSIEADTSSTYIHGMQYRATPSVENASQRVTTIQFRWWRKWPNNYQSEDCIPPPEQRWNHHQPPV